MKKILIPLTLILSYAAASPYITAYAMFNAAENRDADALSSHIDFPILRQNFKDQVNLAISSNAKDISGGGDFAELGAAFGAIMVNNLVDTYVTPIAIAKMMAVEVSPATEGSSKETEQRPVSELKSSTMRYRSWDKFAIAVNEGTDDKGVFVLSRKGLGWKLTNIELPL